MAMNMYLQVWQSGDCARQRKPAETAATNDDSLAG